MIRYVLILATIASLLAPAASAGIVVYGGDKPGWIAAVGGVYQTEDFEDTTLNPGLTYAADINTTIAGGLFNNWVGDSATTWTFPAPVIGVGAYWDLTPQGAGNGAIIKLTYGDFSQETVTPEVPNGMRGGFIGLVSDRPFISATYVAGTQTADPTDINGETLTLDDLVYAYPGSPASGVPEPGTWLLCAAGIAAVAVKARYRR